MPIDPDPELDGLESETPFGPVPAELAQAGAVVDRAIEHMLGQRLSGLAIASALLGGSLGLLARTMGDEAIVQVLRNAMASVRSGDLREPEEDLPGGHA
ncbi:MAG TPA: hypothetical protein VME92_09870 [Acetobacteraceae bacterium]|nr:hypothetical protein [Acetobacteraceae bacterium]